MSAGVKLSAPLGRAALSSSALFHLAARLCPLAAPIAASMQPIP